MKLSHFLFVSAAIAATGCDDSNPGTTTSTDGGTTTSTDNGMTTSTDNGTTTTPLAAKARSGALEAVDGSPGASGFVTIEIAADGSVSINLADDFMQGMGPGDTELRLARTSANLQEQLDADATSASPALAIIPNGASGARSIDVPAGVDVDDFDFAIIWCPTAGINFGTAPLSARTGELAPEAGSPMASGGVSLWVDAAGVSHVTLSADFMQGMGPGDTELRLAMTNANVQEQIDANAASVSDALGMIPNGATGARTFDIPGSVDASTFDYAVVWCPTAGINFGTAQLVAQ